MKKRINKFVALNILKGGLFCLLVAGIFCAQSLHIFGVTPVSELNGPTALEVLSNGTVAPFLYATPTNIFSEMLNTEKCLTGQITPDSNRVAPETSASTYCRDNLLKSVEKAFDDFSIGRISSILSDLLFYATNPDCSKELDAGAVKSPSTDCVGLLAALSDVFTWYKDVEFENKK